MQRVGAIVSSQCVWPAIEIEFTFSDSIAVAADQGAEIRRALQITCEVVVTEHHIREMASAVGRSERSDDAAVIGNLRLHAMTVAEREELGGDAVFCLSKRCT